MRNPFRIGGFEKRLVVAFLLLSVTPTVLIAFFSARYFMRSVDLVSNPAVEQSFANSMNIARTLAARLEEDAGCTAQRLAGEVAGARMPVTVDDLQNLLERVCEETHADFTALYTLEGSKWKLKSSYPETFPRIEREIKAEAIARRQEPATPDSVRAGTRESEPSTGESGIGESSSAEPRGTGQRGSEASGGQSGEADTVTVQPRRIDFPDGDIIASGVVSDGSLYVAGFALEKGFTEKMRKTGDDLGRYRAVGLYVSVLRRYIIIVTSVLVALLVVSSAVISRLMARRISQPITELAHATERIAKGDLEHRVMVNARDEIQSLVADFNKMTEELLENKKNLIRAERIAAWRDVARRIAHEIKNPLTPIEIAIYRIKKRLDSETAGTGPFRDKQVIEESLDSILKEVTALKTIAQEFSAFAKLPEPKFENLNVNDAVRSVLELYSSSSQNVTVKTRLTDGLPAVLADEDQMRSIIANLVKNAFEAMPAGGTLTIATSLLSGWVRIEITDTGPGIPQDIREKIFDPYFTTKPTGTGIGLALAYRILTDHKAKISFKTGEAGTTFVVDLPLPKRGEEPSRDGGKAEAAS